MSTLANYAFVKMNGLGNEILIVDLRDNPSGLHQELWYHGGGCRKWLVVTRDTRTHDISEVKFADGGARGRAARRRAV